MSAPLYSPGFNIAMKVPQADFDSTVNFYANVIGLRVKETPSTDSVVFDFGGKNLWIDRVESLTTAEVWLDIRTHDIDAARDHLASHQITRCDEVEELPEGMKAFWIKNPAGVVHLVSEE
jgi:hypothetical protein